MRSSALILYLLPLLAEAAPHSRKGQQQQNDASTGCIAQQQEKKKDGAKVGKAIYMITNDAQNAVVAIPIGADGKLSAGKMAKTGGAGSIALGADGKPATPDALVGQSALTVVGHVSFHVVLIPSLLRSPVPFEECNETTLGPANMYSRTFSLSIPAPTRLP